MAAGAIMTSGQSSNQLFVVRIVWAHSKWLAGSGYFAVPCGAGSWLYHRIDWRGVQRVRDARVGGDVTEIGAYVGLLLFTLGPGVLLLCVLVDPRAISWFRSSEGQR